MQELLTLVFIACCCLVIVLWLFVAVSRTVQPVNPPVSDKPVNRKQESHKQYTWKKLDKNQLTRRIVHRMQNRDRV